MSDSENPVVNAGAAILGVGLVVGMFSGLFSRISEFTDRVSNKLDSIADTIGNGWLWIIVLLGIGLQVFTWLTAARNFEKPGLKGWLARFGFKIMPSIGIGLAILVAIVAFFVVETTWFTHSNTFTEAFERGVRGGSIGVYLGLFFILNLIAGRFVFVLTLFSSLGVWIASGEFPIFYLYEFILNAYFDPEDAWVGVLYAVGTIGANVGTAIALAVDFIRNLFSADDVSVSSLVEGAEQVADDQLPARVESEVE